MLAKIGTTDITELINESTYKVDSTDKFESWEDGNFVEHRVYTRSQVAGSFDVVLGAVRGTTVEQFVSLLDENTTNHVLNKLAVMVNNKGVVQRIDAYYSLDVKKRRTLTDGELVTVSVKIKER